MIMRKVYYLYAKFFAKNIFSKFNNLLFNIGLRGLGILNYQNSKISGEKRFLKNYLSRLPSPVIFDVGANNGEWSLLVSKIFPEASIYSFEIFLQSSNMNDVTQFLFGSS